MPGPRPAVDTRFLEQIGIAIASGEAPQPLAVKRFERQIEQLRHTDRPELVWVGRLSLAALTWDSARAFEVARAARAAAGANGQLLANIALAFEQMNEMDAALEYAQLAVNASPTYRFAVANRIHVLLALGRWSEAIRATDEYVALVGSSQVDPTLVDDTRPRLAGIAAAGVTESQVQQELALCWAVLRERQVRHRRMTSYNEQDPESGSELFVVRIEILGDIEREMELEEQLAPRLAALPGWDPTRLSVGYTYAVQEYADASL
jgi:tetratricopeptide (TPR) repeat protein